MATENIFENRSKRFVNLYGPFAILSNVAFLYLIYITVVALYPLSNGVITVGLCYIAAMATTILISNIVKIVGHLFVHNA